MSITALDATLRGTYTMFLHKLHIHQDIRIESIDFSNIDTLSLTAFIVTANLYSSPIPVYLDTYLVGGHYYIYYSDTRPGSRNKLHFVLCY